MFKDKLLGLYFPHQYLHVYNDKHLNFFLDKLNAGIEFRNLSPNLKRDVIVNFKNDNPRMTGWSLIEFCKFLYFLGHPNHENFPEETNEENGLDYPIFSPDPQPIEVTLPPPVPLELAEVQDVDKKRRKINFDKELKRKKILGDKGEEIVMKLEAKRLSGRPDLINKIDQVSKRDDGAGFDILSWELDNSERYIEVKATTAKPGKRNFFLTANELKEAQKRGNYYIYIVFEATSLHPKVWCWKNPFKEESDKEMLTPILYRFQSA